MQYLFVILLMFTGAAMGLLVQDPVVCRFTESNQCYVALGRRLHLQVPLEDEDGFDLKITDKTNTARFILKYRKSYSNPPRPNPPRWQFVIDNKTMILTSAERSDSGTYTLETFYGNGNKKGNYTLHLNTEDEVSSVKVSSSCLSPGVMKVFCSADGENLSFSWTSDSNPLTQVENRNSTLILENGNSTLILDKNHHGKVTCRVENHVSSDHDTTELQPCPEPTTTSSTVVTSQNLTTTNLGTNTIVSYNETLSTTQKQITSDSSSWFLYISLSALGSVCVILIIISIFAFCMYKKKESQKNKNASSQDGGELVYAQVTHIPMNQTETRSAQQEEVEYATVVSRASKKKQKKEDDVQYGELVFNTPAKNKRESPEVQDDCVYSQVQHGR